MNKILLFITGTLLLIIFYILFLLFSEKDLKNENNKVLTQTFKKDLEKTINKSNLITPKKEEKIIIKENKKIKLKKEEVENFIQTMDIFEEIDSEIVSEYLKQKEGIAPIMAISMKEGSIMNLSIGDKFNLPSINGFVFTLSIDKKNENNDGSFSLNASIDNEAKKYFAVLTEGKNSSFITVSSPEGVYEIETINGKGYVYSSKDIKNQWIDYSKNDYIITE